MKLPDTPHMRSCFWSYRFPDLDTKKHAPLIIKQILEYGNNEAVDWLEAAYPREIIERVITDSMESEWSRKTLNYLDVVYGVRPRWKSRLEKIGALSSAE